MMDEFERNALLAEISRLKQREESAREFVSRHPALSEADRVEFECFLKIPEMLDNSRPVQ